MILVLLHFWRLDDFRPELRDRAVYLYLVVSVIARHALAAAQGQSRPAFGCPTPG